MTLEEYRYFLGMGKKQKLNNMVLQRKIRLPDTQFLQNEYLRASFFPIDPYSSFYALFIAILVSHNSFFSVQTQNTGRPRQTFQNIQFPCYTFRFSQFGYQQQNKLLIPINYFTLRRKKGTEKLDPIYCAHVEEEEGYREA